MTTLVPLTPHGTAWLRAGLPRGPELPYPHALAQRLARSDLGAEPLAIAWELVRLAAPRPSDPLGAILLVLAVLDACHRGATSIIVPSATPAGIALEERSELLLRARELGLDDAERRALSEALANASTLLAPLLGGPDDARPLVLDEGRLSPSRHVALENRLARALTARAREMAPSSALLAAIAGAGVLKTPDGPVALGAEQLAALRAAVLGTQVVIAGGPGTGKTSIVAAIVRALAGGDTPIVAPSSVALAAPTGKAADRIFASLSATLAEEHALLDRLARAETVHRLLGYRPSDGSFTFHAQNPLPHRLVVIDEASMLDLALAERLVAALSPDARLVLLGDPDQLPSVDPGAVLADLTAGHGAVPVARLTLSHRTDVRDPGGADVRRVASAMRDGKLEASQIAAIEDPIVAAAHASGVAMLGSKRDRIAFLRATFELRFAPILELARQPFDLEQPADLARLERCLALLATARLLTVTRTGTNASSADGVNERLGRLAMDAAREEGLVPGEPLLAHRNDYDRELLNGDQGIVARVVTPSGPRSVAMFMRAGRVVHHPLELVIGTVERAYATTVHKAQGSEHDHVTLLLPDEDVPLLLSRALLYTAVTRARRSVLIAGDPVLLERGVKRASHRVTGLRTSIARCLVGNGQAPRGD